MSLINDALKRAREAQQQARPTLLPGPQLRPVEPAQQARHGLGLLLPVALGVVALFGLFLVWRQRRDAARSRCLHGTRRWRLARGSASAASFQPPDQVCSRLSPIATALPPDTGHDPEYPCCDRTHHPGHGVPATVGKGAC